MNLKQIKWHSFESQVSLDQAAMERVVALAESSIKTRGQFHLVLAGGSTPKNVYTLLKGKSEFKLDLAQITELWKHGSVVRSWLLDLTADALKEDQALDEIAPYVADSVEGRWTVVESIEQGIPTPVLTLALQVRFRSQEKQGYGYRLLSVMRNAFGGHVVKKSK
ncbi:MAG: 6-phosphogluconolactonase [Candidatus Methylopumilus sp.]